MKVVGISLEQAEAMAMDLMDQHGLLAQGWSFGFNRQRKFLGVCWHEPHKRIELSSYHVVRSVELDVRDTLLHEIAHALAGAHAGHGPVWELTAAMLGARPSACADTRYY